MRTVLRRPLPRVLFTALAMALFLHASGVARAAPEVLVKARFRTQPDAKGVHYTPDPNGRVNSNYGWLYSTINVNHSGVSMRSPMMTADGSEYVLTGRARNLHVTRRIKVDVRNGGARVIEILKNMSSARMSVSLVLYAQLNYRYQTLTTNTGRALGGPLGKGECGIVGTLQGTTGTVLYYLCSLRSRIKPTVTAQNNQVLQFQFTIPIAAGATAAIRHGGVVLRRNPPTSKQAIGALFKPYLDRAYTRDLPKEVRRALVNARGGGFGGDATLPSLEEVTGVAPAALDQLAFAEETLLQGTATCRKLTVRGAHGRVDVPFERVAAMIGERCKKLAPRVHLHDGQMLLGSIEAEGLRFEMTSGMAIDLDVGRLDRLVCRTPSARPDAPGTVPTGPDVSYLVETFGGDRLRTVRKADGLAVATQWGEMTVPVADLLTLVIAGEDRPGYWIELTDGSRFRAFVRATELPMASDLFGTVSFRPHEIRRILSVRRRVRAPNDSEDAELVEPNILLAGGDRFVGRIDLDALHFLAPGGTVPQPPAQVRLLQNQSGGAQLEPGESHRFRAEIWGGGHITGELRELFVPVQTTRGRLSVPLRDIVEVHVPTPVVPAALRTRLRALVLDLGDERWSKREAASTALEELGELARSVLEQTARDTKDPEVERRARRLLDKL